METSRRSQGQARSRLYPLALFLALYVVMAGTVTHVTGQGRLPACPPANLARCTCRDSGTGFSVTCNEYNIDVVPSPIPENTTVLNLSGNRITRVLKGDFNRLEQLRTLFLQQNRIGFIQPGAFDNLYHLELLVLNSNSLTYIPGDLFQHLPAIGTIDLQGNLITNIDKRAFLTLPASSTNTRLVTIRLNSNPINCQCGSRAIREWKGTLGGNLAKIKFEGFNCRNAQNVELDNVPEQSFGQCTAADLSMFESLQTCASCSAVSTHHMCDVSSNRTCGVSQPMCHSKIRIVNGVMSVFKDYCSSYADCLLQERRNQELCNVSHTGSVNAMDCTFCCVGPRCNSGDIGGRTNSFKVFVGLRLSQAFQSYMLYPKDSTYIQVKRRYTQQLTNIIASADGGYAVDFLSFQNQTPNTYVSTLVHTTNLNTFSIQSVVNLILDRLNASSRTGFLRKQNVNYIYVGTELATARSCATEVTPTDVGPITWQETATGSSANMPCPSSSNSKPGAFASRQCLNNLTNGVAQWGVPHVDACKQATSNTTRLLAELNNTDITPGNLNTVLDQLSRLSMDGSKLSATDVTIAMDTVDKVLARSYTMTNPAALQATVNVLNNLVDAEPSVLEEANKMGKSASRLLTAADKISEEGVLQSDGQLVLSGANLVVAAQSVRQDSFQGLTLTADAMDDGAFAKGDVTIRSNEGTPPEGVSSLVLPRSLMTSASGSRVAMTVHQNEKVFEAIRQSGGASGGTVASDGSEDPKFVAKVNSHVMAASVVGRDVVNLTDPVTFTLVHDNENSTNPRCVFWDVEAVDWSQRGCRKNDSLSNENVTTCQCDHLTNFALLMDVFNEGASLSETDSKILSIISYIGCGISLLALILTLLTYCLFKNSYGSWSLTEQKLRRDNPSKILVNLCIALALSNLVFVAGMHPYALENTVGCKVVAVLLHFSLLSSLCWMAVEAFYMYLALVLVFKTYYTNFILKCSLVGWGIPLLIIIVTLGINETDNYGPLGTGVCWLKDIAFYAAFVGPVGLILLINIIAFIMVIRQIIGMKDRKLNKSDSFTVSQQLRGALGVAILLGLTWVFGFMAVSQAAVVFYYLFAIFNSLQGLWIFIFYCVMKKEARNSWLRALPCCPTFDDKSGVITSSRDNHEQTQNRIAGYSGTGATHHGAGKSSTDTSNGHTHSTSVTGSKSFSSESESEAVYYNGAVKAKHDPPYANLDKSQPAEPNHVYLNLNYNKDTDSKPKDPSSPPPHGPGVESKVTAYRSEGNITILSTTAPATAQEGLRPIQFHPGKTLTELGVTAQTEETKKPTAPSSPLETDDPRVSPRPLHFKLGHAYSLEPKEEKKEDESVVEPGTPTADDSRNSSVADMIRKLNTHM
ncbi:adhesion G protein-coupled receptor L3-like isoform X2 [Littorina saxatilis]|uniref:adhesion G protein-coupled receptor L3-like isoform X2 n=1 Tax=Littorina saxatilis TaxID=31220 RepID=UPI0038B519ED